MHITQYGTIGEIAEVQASRTHVSGLKEQFRILLAITPDVVMSGGRDHPGVTMISGGDHTKLTEFEREFIELSINEGNVLTAATEETASDTEPVFAFQVVKVGQRVIQHLAL